MSALPFSLMLSNKTGPTKEGERGRGKRRGVCAGGGGGESLSMEGGEGRAGAADADYLKNFRVH